MKPDEAVKAHPLRKKRINRDFLIYDGLRTRAEIEEVMRYERERQFRIMLSVFTYEASASRYVSDEVKWPADWWQAFKGRFAPMWFLVRWPVQYKRKRFDHTLKAHIVVPDVLSDREVFYLYEFDGQPWNVDGEQQRSN